MQDKADEQLEQPGRQGWQVPSMADSMGNDCSVVGPMSCSALVNEDGTWPDRK